MLNLNFNDGIKSYAINGDENRIIRFNPNDTGIIVRFKEAYKAIMDKQDMLLAKAAKLDENMSDEEIVNTTIDFMGDIDSLVYKQIDYVFGEGASDAIFAGQSPTAMAGGQPIVKNFLDSIAGVIGDTAEKYAVEKEERINSYVNAVSAK